jgi:hypothetical protein
MRPHPPGGTWFPSAARISSATSGKGFPALPGRLAARVLVVMTGLVSGHP